MQLDGHRIGIVDRRGRVDRYERCNSERLYASGNVTAAGNAGGLIGENDLDVTQTYATGSVTGSGSVGGLVGFNSGGTNLRLIAIQTTGISSHNGVGNVGMSGVKGLTTAQFGNAANFDWNFGTTAGGGTGCTDGGYCWVIVDADGSLNNAGGAAGATRPMLLSEWSTTITNAHQLQLMALDLNANYTLANNINLGPALSNASDVWGPNGHAGFVSIGGNGTSAFNGTFNGNGNTISNLTINTASLDYVGLFGQIGGDGAVQNLGLSGGSVRGGLSVGALAGGNSGTVTSVYETAAVTGGDVSIVGGLAGSNFSGGTITQSYATGNVMAGVASSAGGLVGENFSSISQSHAAGTVTGGDNASAGGLVGVNFSIVSQSYATGAVTVGDVGSAGGLVGATGLLTVDGNEATNSITNSYATGPVTGGEFSIRRRSGGIQPHWHHHAVLCLRRGDGRRELDRRRTRRGQFHRRFDLKFLCDRRGVERRRQCPARRPGRRKRSGSDDRQFTGLRQRHVDRQPAAPEHQ